MTSPDSPNKLSDGVVVKATLLARLLGLKLLRVEADVTLLPATGIPSMHLLPLERARWDGAADGHTLGDAVELLAHASSTIRDTRQYRI